MILDRLRPRYEYRRELGAGGTGRVLLVRDCHLGRDVALKLFHEAPLGRRDLERLGEEFALLSALEHPGIARAYDFGWADETPYFTSEFVRGGRLPVPDLEPAGSRGAPAGRVEEPGARRERLLALAADLGDALAFLHSNGILHLDVKPSNVLVREESARPVLIDFGLFRRGPLPARGSRLRGSLPYMAPEYFREGELGPWTDVYALGVTLYQMASGRVPRAGASRTRDPRDRASWPALLPSPASARDDVPEALGEVVLKCLALDPSRRFPSGVELAQALRGLGGGSRRGTVRRRLAPLTLGREGVLDAFERLLRSLDSDDRRAREGGAARTLLLTGAPGMGQSHVLRELKVRAQVRGLPCYLETLYPGRRPAPGALLRSLGPHLEPSARERWEDFLALLREPRGDSRGDGSQEDRQLRWAGEVALAAAAIREPFVLAVDGLHDADEVSVLLIDELLRALAALGDGRPRVGLVVGCREEGALADVLRDLGGALFETGEVRALEPLGPRECLELYRASGGSARRDGLSLYQETGGSPAQVVALASPEALDDTAGDRREEGGSCAGLPAPGSASRHVLVTAALLRRPASADELAALAGVEIASTHDAVRELATHGLVVATDAQRVDAEWLASSAACRRVVSADVEERRAAHRRIAAALAREEATAGQLVEAAEQYRAAGDAERVVDVGRRAARALVSTRQNRVALDLLETVRDALVPGRHDEHTELALSAAELHARVGAYDKGIEALRERLRAHAGMPAALRTRVLLRLATLHSRNGDFRLADGLFREALAGDDAGGLEAAERLPFLVEHAAMKVFVGEHAAALELVDDGLALAGDAPGRDLVEIRLNLLAIRANVHLRSFRFEEAREALERALEMAESIGSSVNQAVIQNNLGIIHAQCDRYDRALAAYLEAEAACLRLDEGPSLTFIYGNLATVYGKLGDIDAADEALEKATALLGGDAAPRVSPLATYTVGRRQRHFVEHHRGLVLAQRGRFAAARAAFERAIALGGEVGDSLAVTFDEVFRAECLVFEGRYDEAESELRRLGSAGVPETPRRMSASRLALLLALTGRAGDARSVVGELDAAPPARRIAVLEAWNELFCGWAEAILGDGSGRTRLESAARFFAKHGLRPGAALASWAIAESWLVAGETERARRALAGVHARSDLTAALCALLEARLDLESDGPLTDVADALAEAGAALAGNPLPEWSARLETIRAALGDGSAPRVAERRAALAASLPEEARAAYLESEHWRVWAAVGRGSGRLDGDKFDGEASGARDADRGTRTATLALGDAAVARRGLIVCSPAMRALGAELDGLRDSTLPVLVQGETGAGKDLVARVIHEESRRARGTFRIVDCASLSSQLLEVELFGACRGAYTDLVEDRDGILASAEDGTLYLDEIAGTPLEVQAKLLRFLADGVYRRLGETSDRRADVRLICSTSRDLEREVEAGRFRRELLYRIRVVHIVVPPLRERLADIPSLVARFLEERSGPVPIFGPDALEALAARSWPGNVRELRNVVERLRLEHPERVPTDAVTGPSAAGPTALIESGALASTSLAELQARLEREFILYHLRRLDHDTRAVSELLGIGRKQFYRRCRALGIRLRDLRR